MTARTASRLSARRRRRFLNALALSGNVAAAAREVKLSRSTAYALRQNDTEFRRAWDDAIESAIDLLEEEARNRALHGVEQPRFHQGRPAGTVRKYSDGLLMFLLKAHRPETYRDRADGAREEEPIDHEITTARERLEGRLDRLARAGEEEGLPDGSE